jgi:hypothetical protein
MGANSKENVGLWCLGLQAAFISGLPVDGIHLTWLSDEFPQRKRIQT